MMSNSLEETKLETGAVIWSNSIGQVMYLAAESPSIHYANNYTVVFMRYYNEAGVVSTVFKESRHALSLVELLKRGLVHEERGRVSK